MSLSPYIITVITKDDDPHNVIPFAPIEIRLRLSNGDSGVLADIFEDQLGLTPITQTGATADTNGQFIFFADPAAYNAIYQSQTVPLNITSGNFFPIKDAVDTYLLSDADSGSFIVFNHAGTAALTIPDGLSLGNAVLTNNIGAGSVSIIFSGSDTLKGESLLGDPDGQMSIQKISATVWQSSERA